MLTLSDHYSGECSAVVDGVKALLDLVTDDNARMLGFEKHEDLSSPHVTIGEPFHLYQVDLLDLRHFNPANPASDNVTALLKLNSSLLIYPLLTQRLGDLRPQTRSAVVVSRKGMTWRPTNWGLAELAQAMAAYRTRPGFEGSSVVWIPALNLHFLGDNPNREDLMLIPLADRLAYGIRQGEEISAKTVFTFYAREASSLDEKNPG